MRTSIVFAGSPEVAVPYLRALHAAEIEIRAVITRTDSPQGRKRVVTATAVAIAAAELGLTVIKANSLRDVDIPEVDFGVVVAYGGIVPPRLLASPHHGWLNVHFSVLPSYRGAAPVQRALWDGQTMTGISIFRLVEELDAGPLLLTKAIPFEHDETSTEALNRLAQTTTGDLIATIRLVATNAIQAFPQIGEPSFAPKLSREDGRIAWMLDATTTISRIRAVTSEPGAFTYVDEESFGVLRVSSTVGPSVPTGAVVVREDRVFVGSGAASIELIEVKPAGKTSMSAIDWARGLRTPVTFR